MVSLAAAICLSSLASAASGGWVVLPLGWFLLIMAVAHMLTRLRAAPVVETWAPLAWFAATIGLDILLLVAFLLQPDVADVRYSWVPIMARLHGGVDAETAVPIRWLPTIELILLPMVLIIDICTWILTEGLRHRRSRPARVS
jgi:hypothetical protein